MEKIIMKKNLYRLISLLSILAITQMFCSCSITRTVTVQGYEDLDGNGEKSDNEPWLEGINVTWYGITKTTNVNGSAQFPTQNFSFSDDCRKARSVSVQIPPEYKMTQRPRANFFCESTMPLSFEIFDPPADQSEIAYFGLQRKEVEQLPAQESVVETPTEAPTEAPLIPAPALSLEKTVDHNACIMAGEKFLYTYIFRNTGNVPLTAPFKLSDDKISSFVCDTALETLTLQPNESATCYAQYITSEQEYKSGASIHNQAFVTAIFEGKEISSNVAVQDVVCYPPPKDNEPEDTQEQPTLEPTPVETPEGEGEGEG